MALNIQVFKTRALTALLFVIIMLAGLLWNWQAFLILFTIVHFGCWYEFVKLMKKIFGVKFLPYCLLGLVYITMPVLMLISLTIEYHIYTVNIPDKLIFSWAVSCGIVFSIWINDTMAYLVGSFIGKTPLTKISPKKTVEGTAGGIILCILAIGFLYPLLLNQFAVTTITGINWFIVAAICAVFGTLGDLLESKIKRMADVKDSGSFMPGHGGFLDRFDSLLVAVPFVWLYVQLFV